MRDSLFCSNHGWTASLASIVDHELLFLSLAACTVLSGWKTIISVFKDSGGEEQGDGLLG